MLNIAVVYHEFLDFLIKKDRVAKLYAVENISVWMKIDPFVNDVADFLKF